MNLTEIGNAQRQVLDLKARYKALIGRIADLNEVLRVKGRYLADRSDPSKKAYALLFTDMKLIETITKIVDVVLKNIDLHLHKNGNGFGYRKLNVPYDDLAHQLVESIYFEYDLHPDIVLSAIIQSVSNQLDTIEAIIVRAEASAAAIGD